MISDDLQNPTTKTPNEMPSSISQATQQELSMWAICIVMLCISSNLHGGIISPATNYTIFHFQLIISVFLLINRLNWLINIQKWLSILFSVNSDFWVVLLIIFVLIMCSGNPLREPFCRNPFQEPFAGNPSKLLIPPPC